MRSGVYPLETRRARSRARVAGLHETYMRDAGLSFVIISMPLGLMPLLGGSTTMRSGFLNPRSRTYVFNFSGDESAIFDPV